MDESSATLKLESNENLPMETNNAMQESDNIMEADMKCDSNDITSNPNEKDSSVCDVSVIVKFDNLMTPSPISFNFKVNRKFLKIY